MTPAAWIAIIGIGVTCFLAILGHIIASAFWAGKITARLDILLKDSSDAKSKMEVFQQNCFTKADAAAELREADNQHKAIWKKIDALKKAVIRLFQKFGLDITQEEI